MCPCSSVAQSLLLVMVVCTVGRLGPHVAQEKPECWGVYQLLLEYDLELT